MKYNFDELTERRSTGSYKWDSDIDAEMLPMWVADMDFRTAPAVVEALQRRIDGGIFGYVRVPDSYYAALASWFSRRHDWHIKRSDVIYTSGVVPALSAIIKALTEPGDGVIVQTPAYNCFFSSVRNNRCRIVENRLSRVTSAEGFSYEMNFEELDYLASAPSTKVLILCNPHNPSGRVWTRSELERVRDICTRNGVIVVSDEIHCELTHPGYDYVPYATVDSDAIVCCSPSKAFNIAGLQIANIVVPDAIQRMRIDRAINDNEVCDVNPLGVVALEAAYNEGEEWLDCLNIYLYDNYCYLRSELLRRMPMLKVCCSESTYLAWVDITELGISADEVEQTAKNRTKVWVNSGVMYGGEGYIRINFACPRARLADGIDRFCRAFGY